MLRPDSQPLHGNMEPKMCPLPSSQLLQVCAEYRRSFQRAFWGRSKGSHARFPTLSFCTKACSSLGKQVGPQTQTVVPEQDRHPLYQVTHRHVAKITPEVPGNTWVWHLRQRKKRLPRSCCSTTLTSPSANTSCPGHP